MPKVYFGFDAESVPKKQIFVSYSRGDAYRVKEVTFELHQIGLPIWYDDGLIPGNMWKKEILRQIKQSRLAIFFLTKDLFRRDRSFMIDEYQFAKDHNIPRISIWLDNIGKIDCTTLDDEMYLWWSELCKLQSIEVFDLKSNKKMAEEIFDGICKKDDSIIGLKNSKNEIKEEITKPVISETSIQKKLSVHSMPKIEKKIEKSENMNSSVKTKSVIFSIGLLIISIVVVWAILGEFLTNNNSQYELSNTKSLSDLENVSVGTCFTFGNYKQGKNGEILPIEWRVLEIEDGKALVLTDAVLDEVAFNEIEKSVTWNNCTLRKWMNDDFLNAAFSSSEQEKIATVVINNHSTIQFIDENGKTYKSKKSDDTEDKIFALSIEETVKYCSTHPGAMYSEYIYDKYGMGMENASWWTRSTALDSIGDEVVQYSAWISNGDDWYVESNDYHSFIQGDVRVTEFVRPAMWIIL